MTCEVRGQAGRVVLPRYSRLGFGQLNALLLFLFGATVQAKLVSDERATPGNRFQESERKSKSRLIPSTVSLCDLSQLHDPKYLAPASEIEVACAKRMCMETSDM